MRYRSMMPFEMHESLHFVGYLTILISKQWIVSQLTDE